MSGGRPVKKDRGDRTCVQSPRSRLTYSKLETHDLGEVCDLAPGLGGDEAGEVHHIRERTVGGEVGGQLVDQARVHVRISLFVSSWFG